MIRSRLPGLLFSLALILALALPGRADGAGMITHAWIADKSIESISDPDLRSFLTLHNHELLSGASYPDGGYFAGGYGEISHWERFVDGYIQYLRGRNDCGDLADPLGPCAPQVAHMLGVGAHGMGDEMWDWMFEPLVTDHDEEPLHPIAPPEVNGVIGNIEYAMDTIALADHFRWAGNGYYLPPPNQLTPIYSSIGHSHTEADILAGHAGGSAALTAERLGGAADAPRVREQMPWSSAHMHDESGGVFDSAEGVAGYIESLWAKLLDDAPPAPEVVANHPEDGQEGVPWRFHPAKTSPGPHSGGGELRILAVLSSAVDPDSINAQNFKLLGPDGIVATRRGSIVPSHEARREASTLLAPIAPLGGYPRPGPYGFDDGTHSIMTYPASDLEPCTTYTALLTTGVRDWADLPINIGLPLEQDFSWSFTTRSTDGQPCPDPPIDPPIDPGDPPLCRGLVATVWVPDPGSGVIVGTDAADVIAGGSGDDTITGGKGDDLICPKGGDDTVYGGGGDDQIHAKAGDDRVRANGGDDLVRANAGNDFVNTGPGDDRLHAGAGDDEARGNSGDDRIHGHSGDDTLRGGTGEDRCKGGQGRDTTNACETVRGAD